ncbi:MAG: 16S rRNA (uracil(1498)-N(3))-methyltransferase [Lachnospiraceae bacterium]|nr:16S rRNA (uracil(1498)-N(3))-methyltransferase [Lachnospiraceae bacterium]MBR1851690.1 16S rRNA (uracil(1498)-N(3))-methyltransferase [Lachnospiraceae bacterium]
MYQFFVDSSQIDMENKTVTITGADVNHIKNVLRMKPGEELAVSNGQDGREYRCAIRAFREAADVQPVCRQTSGERSANGQPAGRQSADGGATCGFGIVDCELRFVKEEGVELPVKITLFQGLPKADKMELIIQKAVELGVYRVVPVEMKRCVVKLDAKKAKAKTARWQQIAEAAAKQSKRAVIPEIAEPVSFRQALESAEKMQVKLLPYELAEGMEKTRTLLQAIAPGQEVAVFIGPEGGFDEAEVQAAREQGMEPITLGRRILRTETAGMTVLSWLVYLLEGRQAES